MNKKIQSIGSKPIGIKGKLAGIIMNIIHSNTYKKIIKKYLINETNSTNSFNILDIGCGGGKAVNILSSLLINSKIYGIDHSIDMVNLSKKVNNKEIKNNKVEIIQGDVIRLPYSNNYFDIITAFDTINFWKDYKKAVTEIKRVLMDNGIFLIINAFPKEGTKWYDFVKFKNENEYREALSQYNFKKINIILQRNTIIIKVFK